MKRILYLSIFFLIFNCSNDPEAMIPHLNGYWEIEKVILENGQKRDYTVNLTVDYISVNDSLKGFRKKLKPNLNGGFETSDDAENLEVTTEGNTLIIHYKTPYSNWTESILKANEKELHVKNDQNTTYIYKRYQPLNLN